MPNFKRAAFIALLVALIESTRRQILITSATSTPASLQQQTIPLLATPPTRINATSNKTTTSSNQHPPQIKPPHSSSSSSYSTSVSTSTSTASESSNQNHHSQQLARLTQESAASSLHALNTSETTRHNTWVTPTHDQHQLPISDGDGDDSNSLKSKTTKSGNKQSRSLLSSIHIDSPRAKAATATATTNNRIQKTANDLISARRNNKNKNPSTHRRRQARKSNLNDGDELHDHDHETDTDTEPSQAEPSPGSSVTSSSSDEEDNASAQLVSPPLVQIPKEGVAQAKRAARNVKRKMDQISGRVDQIESVIAEDHASSQQQQTNMNNMSSSIPQALQYQNPIQGENYSHHQSSGANFHHTSGDTTDELAPTKGPSMGREQSSVEASGGSNMSPSSLLIHQKQATSTQQDQWSAPLNDVDEQQTLASARLNETTSSQKAASVKWRAPLMKASSSSPTQSSSRTQKQMSSSSEDESNEAAGSGQAPHSLVSPNAEDVQQQRPQQQHDEQQLSLSSETADMMKPQQNKQQDLNEAYLASHDGRDEVGNSLGASLAASATSKSVQLENTLNSQPPQVMEYTTGSFGGGNETTGTRYSSGPIESTSGSDSLMMMSPANNANAWHRQSHQQQHQYFNDLNSQNHNNGGGMLSRNSYTVGNQNQLIDHQPALSGVAFKGSELVDDQQQQEQQGFRNKFQNMTIVNSETDLINSFSNQQQQHHQASGDSGSSSASSPSANIIPSSSVATSDSTHSGRHTQQPAATSTLVAQQHQHQQQQQALSGGGLTTSSSSGGSTTRKPLAPNHGEQKKNSFYTYSASNYGKSSKEQQRHHQQSQHQQHSPSTTTTTNHRQSISSPSENNYIASSSDSNSDPTTTNGLLSSNYADYLPQQQQQQLDQRASGDVNQTTNGGGPSTLQLSGDSYSHSSDHVPPIQWPALATSFSSQQQQQQTNNNNNNNIINDISNVGLANGLQNANDIYSTIIQAAQKNRNQNQDDYGLSSSSSSSMSNNVNHLDDMLNTKKLSSNVINSATDGNEFRDRIDGGGGTSRQQQQVNYQQQQQQLPEYSFTPITARRQAPSNAYLGQSMSSYNNNNNNNNGAAYGAHSGSSSSNSSDLKHRSTSNVLDESTFNSYSNPATSQMDSSLTTASISGSSSSSNNNNNIVDQQQQQHLQSTGTIPVDSSGSTSFGAELASDYSANNNNNPANVEYNRNNRFVSPLLNTGTSGQASPTGQSDGTHIYSASNNPDSLSNALDNTLLSFGSSYQPQVSSSRRQYNQQQQQQNQQQIDSAESAESGMTQDGTESIDNSKYLMALAAAARNNNAVNQQIQAAVNSQQQQLNQQQLDSMQSAATTNSNNLMRQRNLSQVAAAIASQNPSLANVDINSLLRKYQQQQLLLANQVQQQQQQHQVNENAQPSTYLYTSSYLPTSQQQTKQENSSPGMSSRRYSQQDSVSNGPSSLSTTNNPSYLISSRSQALPSNSYLSSSGLDSLSQADLVPYSTSSQVQPSHSVSQSDFGASDYGQSSSSRSLRATNLAYQQAAMAAAQKANQQQQQQLDNQMAAAYGSAGSGNLINSAYLTGQSGLRSSGPSSSASLAGSNYANSIYAAAAMNNPSFYDAGTNLQQLQQQQQQQQQQLAQSKMAQALDGGTSGNEMIQRAYSSSSSTNNSGGGSGGSSGASSGSSIPLYKPRGYLNSLFKPAASSRFYYTPTLLPITLGSPTAMHSFYAPTIAAAPATSATSDAAAAAQTAAAAQMSAAVAAWPAAAAMYAAASSNPYAAAYQTHHHSALTQQMADLAASAAAQQQQQQQQQYQAFAGLQPHYMDADMAESSLVSSDSSSFADPNASGGGNQALSSSSNSFSSSSSSSGNGGSNGGSSSSNGDDSGNSNSKSGKSMTPWSTAASLLLGVLPLGMLMALMLPAVSVTGRKKRELELSGRNFSDLLKWKAPSKVLEALMGGFNGKESSLSKAGAIINEQLASVSSKLSSLDQSFLAPSSNGSSKLNGQQLIRARSLLTPSLSSRKTINNTNDKSNSWDKGLKQHSKLPHVSLFTMNDRSSNPNDLMYNVLSSTESSYSTNNNNNNTTSTTLSSPMQTTTPMPLMSSSGAGAGVVATPFVALPQFLSAASTNSNQINPVGVGVKAKVKKAISALNSLIVAAQNIKRKHRSSPAENHWNSHLPSMLRNPFKLENLFNINEFKRQLSSVIQTRSLISSHQNSLLSPPINNYDQLGKSGSMNEDKRNEDFTTTTTSTTNSPTTTTTTTTIATTTATSLPQPSTPLPPSSNSAFFSYENEQPNDEQPKVAIDNHSQPESSSSVQVTQRKSYHQFTAPTKQPSNTISLSTNELEPSPSLAFVQLENPLVNRDQNLEYIGQQQKQPMTLTTQLAVEQQQQQGLTNSTHNENSNYPPKQLMTIKSSPVNEPYHYDDQYQSSSSIVSKQEPSAPVVLPTNSTRHHLEVCLNQFLCRLTVKLNKGLKRFSAQQPLNNQDEITNNHGQLSNNNNNNTLRLKLNHSTSTTAAGNSTVSPEQLERMTKKYINQLIEQIEAENPHITLINKSRHDESHIQNHSLFSYDKKSHLYNVKSKLNLNGESFNEQQVSEKDPLDTLYKNAMKNQCTLMYNCLELLHLENMLNKMKIKFN